MLKTAVIYKIYTLKFTFSLHFLYLKKHVNKILFLLFSTMFVEFDNVEKNSSSTFVVVSIKCFNIFWSAFGLLN